MLVLSNIFQDVFNKFSKFYGGLSTQGRFVLAVIALLLVVLFVLIIVLTDQIRKNHKIIKANKINSSNLPVPEETAVLDIDEENEKTRNLKEITDKIQAVIDNRNNDIEKFEKDQEESSIISYNDLLKAAGKPVIEEPVKDEFKLPEVARKIEADDILDIPVPIITNEPKEERFKSSDFISPIFGVQGKGIQKKEEINAKIEEPKPINNMELKVDDEEEIEILDLNVKNEEEFLSTLKDLRNNLD
jgi:uncharacterized membrane protein